jgi:hypothetical protein
MVHWVRAGLGVCVQCGTVVGRPAAHDVVHHTTLYNNAKGLIGFYSLV